MVRKCIVCGTAQSKKSVWSFHRFPKREDRRLAWLSACHLSETDIQLDTLICSQHFKEDDYDSNVWPKTRLREDAVPSPSNIYLKRRTHVLSVQQPASMPSTSEVETTSFLDENLPIATSETAKTPPRDVSNVISKTPRFIGDLQPEHFSTPRRAKRNLDFVKRQSNKYQKRIKLLTQGKRRLESNIESIKSLLQHLRQHRLLSEESANILEDCTPDSLKEILNRQLVNKNRKYSPEIRAFALTLHFYSVNAYQYVRKQFNNLLPHLETIRQWYKVIDGEPGFTKEAFDAIKLKVESSEDNVIVNLVIDEMSIRQLIEWQNGKYYGFVDVGTNLNSNGENLDEAKHALVFMAVAINAHWKIPLAYFLISSLNSQERSNLLNMALELLYETGAMCQSITFDGAPVNIAMCNSVGTNYSVQSFQPWFSHICTKEKVHTFWDACHMIKLVRNTLGERKILYNSAGGKIEWRYIELLYQIQCKEGLSAATKLTSRHINFHNEKMKVKLAVQVLSSSVSAALLFCKEIDIAGFEECDATAKFCSVFNDIFDILNSRNLYSRSLLNRPLSSANYDLFQEKINIYIQYINSLKNDIGISLIDSNRKTGFLGLIVSLTSYLNLYKDLVLRNYLKFILSYKLSQDHLETFFSALRRRGGLNNNPSALQFRTAYKRLLVRHQITASSLGNCSILDATTILNIGSGIRSGCMDTIVEEEIDPLILVETDHDYFSSLIGLSSFVEDIVKYIAGFVVRKISKKITCQICSSHLYGKEVSSILFSLKNRGKLTVPSEDVIKVCSHLETLIRQYKKHVFSMKNFKHWVTIKLLADTNDLFNSEEMISHILNQDVLNNHRYQLLTLITDIYLKLRLHHEAKMKVDSSSVRQKYTKLILFSHQ